MNSALFLDRDGIITQLDYNSDEGKIHNILHPDRLKLVPGIIQLLRISKRLGFKHIIVSNQPDVGLKRINKKKFYQISEKMKNMLLEKNIRIDGEYYCFHHPYAESSFYRKICDCRKPKPGMILQAAVDHRIDLSASYMIGDGVHDVAAGCAAGCKTILLTNPLESEYLRIIRKNLHGIRPDFMVKKLTEIIPIISPTV